MPLVDYRCGIGHTTERVIFGAKPPSMPCPTCGRRAPRQWGAVHIVAPEVDSRNMFRRFSEASAEIEHMGLPGPDLWRASKNLARAASRVGENPMEIQGA